MSTPAEEIRAAAQHIRDLAVLCPTWPWQVDPGDAEQVIAADHEVVADAFGLSGNQTRNTARYIATWDPGMAMLAAGLLDHWALHFENRDWINNRPGDARTRIIGMSVAEENALALATAINAKAEAGKA